MSNTVGVKLDDLEHALLWTSNIQASAEAYFCRTTGKAFFVSNFDDDGQILPDNLQNPHYFVSFPHKQDLGLDQYLVFEFVETHFPDHYPTVREFFSRPGAYRRFKDFLDELDCLDQWYEYQHAAHAKALKHWAESQGFVIVDVR